MLSAVQFCAFCQQHYEVAVSSPCIYAALLSIPASYTLPLYCCRSTHSQLPLCKSYCLFAYTWAANANLSHWPLSSHSVHFNAFSLHNHTHFNQSIRCVAHWLRYCKAELIARLAILAQTDRALYQSGQLIHQHLAILSLLTGNRLCLAEFLFCFVLFIEYFGF